MGALGALPPIGVSMLASTAFHLVVILGVGFTLADPRNFKSFSEPLQVVLVNARSVTRPEKPDVLAQANLDGGGNTDDKRRAKSPLPVLPKETQNLELGKAKARVQELEQEARRLMTQTQSKQALPSDATHAEQPPRPDKLAKLAQPSEVADSADLRERALEIARLQAQIDQDWDAYQKRPRRTFVGARAQNVHYARYVEDWRIKIERVGTLNFPTAARQQGVLGNLQLSVAIRADGSVESVQIERPSGHKILDQAALRIVELASPFAPLPPEIRRHTDILHIIRTWTFTRSDLLAVTQ